MGDHYGIKRQPENAEQKPCRENRRHASAHARKRQCNFAGCGPEAESKDDAAPVHSVGNASYWPLGDGAANDRGGHEDRDTGRVEAAVTRIKRSERPEGRVCEPDHKGTDEPHR